jgi:Tfp pilus assembly protein PilN
MALINLLPDAKAHPKKIKGKTAQDSSVTMLKTFIFILALLSILTSGGWYSLSSQIKAKENEMSLLNKKTSALKTGQNEIEKIKKIKKGTLEKLSFYEKILENNMLWSKKLSVIGKTIPPQVWLTSIHTETAPKKMLVIRGSATSLVESEIIDSISQFVERLKNEDVFI